MITTIDISELTAGLVSSFGVVRIEAGKQLSPEELVWLARSIGKPQAFSLQKYRPAHYPPEITVLDSRGDGVTSAPSGFGEGWHQDSTYLPKPPEFTVLHALKVPESGGETLFADTRPALGSLSSELVAKLHGLELIHALNSSYRISASDVGKTLGELTQQLPRTSHPILIDHPRSGRTLCLSPLYTVENVQPNIRGLFDQVLAEVIKGETSHKWKSGDVVIWDNRVVLHAATAYRGEQRRLMMRSVVHDTGDAQ